MDTFGQFILFVIFAMSAWHVFRIIATLVRFWVSRRLIAIQVENAILINEKISPRDTITYRPEVTEIVEQIIIQMCSGLKFQYKPMTKHAIQYVALLYRTDVWLSNELWDEKLHDAIDVIKQKFYYMHGTFINIKKSELRNHIELRLYTTSGDPVPDVKELKRDPSHGNGCRVRIIVSIVTPLTPKNYWYIKHLD